jgi:hypothetical protein
LELILKGTGNEGSPISWKEVFPLQGGVIKFEPPQGKVKLKTLYFSKRGFIPLIGPDGMPVLIRFFGMRLPLSLHQHPKKL